MLGRTPHKNKMLLLETSVIPQCSSTWTFASASCRPLLHVVFNYILYLVVVTVSLLPYRRVNFSRNHKYSPVVVNVKPQERAHTHPLLFPIKHWSSVLPGHLWLKSWYFALKIKIWNQDICKISLTFFTTAYSTYFRETQVLVNSATWRFKERHSILSSSSNLILQSTIN